MRRYSLSFAHATLFVAFVGAVDYLTGYQISIGVFYLLPIGLLSWSGGLRQGVLLACLSAVCWLIADIFSGATYDSPFIPYWNALTRLAIFVAVAMLVGQRSAETGTIETRKQELETLVTERTAAIRESELRYRRLFEASQDGILILDPSTGQIVDVNPCLEYMLGQSREELVGQRFWDIDAFQNIAANKDAFRELHTKKDTRYEDLTLICKDGKQKSVEFVSHVYRMAYEDVIQCNIRDISQRRQAEEALRASEAQHRDLFESATYGIFRATVEGRFLDVNPALVRMLGYASKEELLAINLPHGVYRDPAARALTIDEIRQKGRTQDFEVEWKRKDGRIIIVRLNGRILRDARGDAIGFEDFVEDVTERRSLEQQFRQAQKMEAVGRLAGGVAHDFNNLLGVIIGYAELLAGQTGTLEPQRHQIEEIRKAGQRAAGLTKQLLAFSRQQVLEPRVLNLNHLVEDLTKMLQRLVGEHIELSNSLDPRLGQVKADQSQIEQVIMNLVVNARDAMPEGGKLTIQTLNADLDEGYAQRHHPATPGRYVMVAVSDTGVGMDEEIQSHIFEPFFTTKGQGKGTGLGLATVYGIVKQSGGYIWVYSEPGHGATFKIYLPRVDEPVEKDERQNTKVGQPLGSETVLVVEDEAALRAVTCEFLRSVGYSVLAAKDGFEALQISAQHPGPIHALVTDVVMPQMGGAELAQRLKAARPEIAVLYVSGYSDETLDYQKVLEEGRFLLSKPFTRDGLCGKLRQALASRGPNSTLRRG